MSDFADKTVLVTGGAGAIGRAAGAVFAGRGAQVVLADIDARALAATADGLGDGGKVTTVVADLSTKEGARAAVESADRVSSGLDVVFNNAGIAGVVAPVHELEVEAFDHIMATNLRSMFLVLKYAAAAMIEHAKGGAIVNMGSSMAGWDVLWGGAGYACTKHGVIGLTKAAAVDLGGHGIRVNAVCPGVIETALGVPGLDGEGGRSAAETFADRIPTRRIGQPGDVAEVVAFLASQAAAHVSGAAWLIDGGQTLQSFSNGPESGAYPLVGR